MSSYNSSTGKDAIVEGEWSNSFHFSTRPTSRPTNLECNAESESRLEFTWNEPDQIPNDLAYNIDYEYELKSTNVENYTCKCEVISITSDAAGLGI